MPRDRKWLCLNESCKALLGFVDEEKNQVRIKYKDLYVTVEGGRISLICRRCAKVNELVDQDYLNYVANILVSRKEEVRETKGEAVKT